MRFRSLFWACALLLSWALPAAEPPQPLQTGEELLTTQGEPGRHGGRMVFALRAEPKTLNPVVAIDAPSRDVIGPMMGDLLHINRATQLTEPALAKEWKVSPDGLRYTLKLRRGLRFSDGHPLSVEDVLFSFTVYLDEKLHAPQRDLLVVGGKPIVVRRVDAHTVAFELSQPYAAAERLFDSIPILPKHLLSKPYQDGTLPQAWGLNAKAGTMAGLGPYRFKEYIPGQRLVLERNPYYWKMDRRKNRLPYLDEVVFIFVASEDAQVIRFQSGETNLISRMSADNYAVLERERARRSYQLYDLGPGLEYNFLFFNQNTALPKDAAKLAEKQAWFRDRRFRHAVSLAIDRNAIIRLVYRGRGTPLQTHVTPANKLWINSAIALEPRSVAKARDLLKAAGYSWDSQGALLDDKRRPVEFSILSSASNAQRTQMATMIQSDLKELGIKATVVPLEFRSLLDRVFQTHDYEAVVLALGGGDVDPNPQMNVWLSSGSNHLWNLGQKQPATPWEAEIDSLMRKQLSTLKIKDRKRMYDRVQQLVAEQLPLICLASPNILVGAQNNVANLKPAILEHYVLWNVDELYFRDGSPRR